jgi:hypothetical protein
MKLATTIAQNVVRTLGVIQIALGMLFWTYNALNLIPLHTLIGLVISGLAWWPWAWPRCSDPAFGPRWAGASPLDRWLLRTERRRDQRSTRREEREHFVRQRARLLVRQHVPGFWQAHRTRSRQE